MRKLKGLAYFILGWGGIIATLAVAPKINMFFVRYWGVPPVVILALLAGFGFLAVKSFQLIPPLDKMFYRFSGYLSLVSIVVFGWFMIWGYRRIDPRTAFEFGGLWVLFMMTAFYCWMGKSHLLDKEDKEENTNVLQKQK